MDKNNFFSHVDVNRNYETRLNSFHLNIKANNFKSEVELSLKYQVSSNYTSYPYLPALVCQLALDSSENFTANLFSSLSL